MPEFPSVERRLILLLAIIAGVAVLGVLAIVPYRLYERDIRTAEVNAHRIASVVHASLSRAAAEGDDLADLVNRFQGVAASEITLERIDPGEVHPAASAQRGKSVLRGTDLSYTAPPIIDREGRTLVASMRFDLSPMKRSSVNLIIGLVAAVVLGSLVFSMAVFYLIRHSLVTPLRVATARYAKLGETGEAPDPPSFHTREMNDLVHAIEALRVRAR
jgi:hypothetical protein